MTQEDKELLLKYLCMALPYGVKTKYVNTFCKIKQIVFEKRSTSYLFKDNNFSLSINDIQVWKPYLRSMSSMTEKEVKEFYDIECIDAKVGYIRPTWNWHFTINGINWLLENHFDLMGLIPKGLAIEVTPENNPYKD